MEDASHGDLDGSVVEIDRFWVVRSAPRAEWLSRSEQGFDGFVAQDEERRHRPETGRQRPIFCGNVVIALPHRTVDDRNIVQFGIAANATAETAGQPHQVGIFEGFVRPGQRPPPDGKPTGTMPHAEVGVQNDPIHAIVAAAQEILIQSAQPICHGGYARRTPAYFKLPRRGHFFAAQSAKKRSIPYMIAREQDYPGVETPITDYERLKGSSSFGVE